MRARSFDAPMPAVGGLPFEDDQVGLSINGLAPADLGELSLAELVTETILRTQRFAVSCLKLLVSTAYAEEKLTFEASVLDAILDGFERAGHKPELAAFAAPKANFLDLFRRLFKGSDGAKDTDEPVEASAHTQVTAQTSSGGEREVAVDAHAAAQATSATGPATASPVPGR